MYHFQSINFKNVSFVKKKISKQRIIRKMGEIDEKEKYI